MLEQRIRRDEYRCWHYEQKIIPVPWWMPNEGWSVVFSAMSFPEVVKQVCGNKADVKVVIER